MQTETNPDDITWTLLGWENDGWVELNGDYSDEEDAIRALTKAEESQDRKFPHFALMRSDEQTYPPRPRCIG